MVKARREEKVLKIHFPNGSKLHDLICLYEETHIYIDKKKTEQRGNGQMLKKTLTMGVMVIMSLSLTLGLAACGVKDTGIWYFVNNEHGFSTDGLDEHPTITKLVKSVDELQQLCDESGITYTGKKYDEAFFVDKAIIVRAFWYSPYVTSELNKIQIVDNMVTFYITTYTPKEDYPAIVSFGIGCYEVNKADLSNANEVQIITKNKTK